MPKKLRPAGDDWPLKLRTLKVKIIQFPECICTEGDQTVDHLIYDCRKLEKEKLIAHISREDDWPVQKSVLVNKYLQQFGQFANSIDFEKL
jgi:hypothetical protein